MKKAHTNEIIPDDITKTLLDVFSFKTRLPIGLFQVNNDEGVFSDESLNNFRRFCSFIHRVGLYDECRKDHRRRAKENLNEEITLCHMGLYNWATPIKVNNIKVASLLYGQARFKDKSYNRKAATVFNNRIAELDLPRINKFYLRILYRLVTKIDHETNELSPLRKVVKWIYQTTQNLVTITKEKDLIEVEKSILLEEKEQFEKQQNTLTEEKRIHEDDKLKLDQFTTNVIHDLGLSIQGALAECDNLLNYGITDEFDQETRARDVKKVLSHLIYVSNIIQNITKSFWTEYAFKPTAIIRVLNFCKDTFDYFAEKKNVVINLDCYTRVGQDKLELSEEHITNAFLNLFSNAVKYSYKGTKLAKKEVKIVGRPEAEYYVVTISNFGVGILPSEEKDIYKPGYKGILARDERRTGGGHGLARARKIIEDHGGFIDHSSAEIDSIYQTTFFISLPYKQI